jgi:peptide deformylase
MIITDEKLLRVNCLPATLSEAKHIIGLLEVELGKVKGIGLAAPQIGIAKTVAIVRTKDISVNLVNCKIDKRFEEFEFTGEGCLSFPGIFLKTKRFRQVVVIDNLVEPYNFLVTGLSAVAVDHEMDHWNGRLLPDMK